MSNYQASRKSSPKTPALTCTTGRVDLQRKYNKLSNICVMLYNSVHMCSGRADATLPPTDRVPIVDLDVAAAESRPEPGKSSDASPRVRWGAYHCGINLATLVCPRHKLAFEVEHRWREVNSIRNPPTDPPALQFSDGRVPSTILQTTAIDVLVADHSSDRNMNGKHLEGSSRHRSI